MHHHDTPSSYFPPIKCLWSRREALCAGTAPRHRAARQLSVCSAVRAEENEELRLHGLWWCSFPPMWFLSPRLILSYPNAFISHIKWQLFLILMQAFLHFPLVCFFFVHLLLFYLCCYTVDLFFVRVYYFVSFYICLLCCISSLAVFAS